MSPKETNHKKGTYGIVTDLDKDIVTKTINKYNIVDKCLNCATKNDGNTCENCEECEDQTLREIAFMSIYKKKVSNYPVIIYNDKTIQILMENEGIDLSNWFKLNKLKYVSRIKLLPTIVYQLVKQIYALEMKNMFHGDINTQNILFSGNIDSPIVKLIDWGSICFVPELRIHNTCASSLTAPELDKRNPHGCTGSYKSDIFTLGLVINYILLKGIDCQQSESVYLACLDKEIYPLRKDVQAAVSLYLGKSFTDLWNSMLIVDRNKRISAIELYYDDIFASYRKNDNYDTNIYNNISDVLKQNMKIIMVADHLGRQKIIDWIYQTLLLNKKLNLLSLTIWLMDQYLIIDKNITNASLVVICCICIADNLINSYTWLFSDYLTLIQKEKNNDTIKEMKEMFWKIIRELNGIIYNPTFDQNVKNINYKLLMLLLLDSKLVNITNNELYDLYQKINDGVSYHFELTEISSKYIQWQS